MPSGAGCFFASARYDGQKGKEMSSPLPNDRKPEPIPLVYRASQWVCICELIVSRPRIYPTEQRYIADLRSRFEEPPEGDPMITLAVPAGHAATILAVGGYLGYGG